MAARRTHGGGCCGINHISGFGGGETKEHLLALIGTESRRRTRSMILEVVLTNGQCKQYPNHPKWLQELGFKLVSRFCNPNSGNICNVFHYNKYPKSLTSSLPFKLVEPDNAAV